MSLRDLYPRLESVVRNFVGGTAGVTDIQTTKVPHKKLSAAVGYYLGDRDIHSIFTDGSYVATTQDGMEKLYQESPVEDDLYRPEVHDCEDFARGFRNFCVKPQNGVSAVGTVYDWSNAHAYNIVYHADGSLNFFEPQKGEVVELGDEITFDTVGTTVTYDPQKAAVII